MRVSGRTGASLLRKFVVRSLFSDGFLSRKRSRVRIPVWATEERRYWVLTWSALRALLELATIAEIAQNEAWTRTTRRARKKLRRSGL